MPAVADGSQRTVSDGQVSGDVQAMFTAIIRDETALGRPVSAATLHRIHATLRAALNPKLL